MWVRFVFSRVGFVFSRLAIPGIASSRTLAMKNHCQSPLYCLSRLSTYKLPPNHPVVIIITTTADATTRLGSRKQIHKEKTVKPVYRSTSETMPRRVRPPRWCTSLHRPRQYILMR